MHSRVFLSAAARTFELLVCDAGMCLEKRVTNCKWFLTIGNHHETYLIMLRSSMTRTRRRSSWSNSLAFALSVRPFSGLVTLQADYELLNLER